MATTIKLKNGSGAPLASDLVQGEPAFDLTNKRLYTEDSGGTVIEVGTTPTSLTTTGTVTFGSLSDGAITITAFVDEDNMVSNSATLVPTQQSVKAYVDSQVTAQDLDFQGDSGGALSIDLDSETLTIAGGTGIDTTGATNTLTVAIDSTVTTLTGTQTLTNKTLTAPVISSISNTGTLTLPTSTDTLVGRATTDTLTNKTLTSPVINTSVSGTAVLDDDTFATASATTLATSESIKAYVDSQVASADTLAELTDTNITTPADGALLFYDTTTTKWIDNVVSGDITIADTGVAAIGSGVIVNDDVNASAAISVSKTALTAGTGLTLTTDTLSVDASQTQITAVGTIGTGTWQGTAIADAYVADNLTISGGTVDNTVIGGTTAAAGTFTTFTSTGIDDNATSTAITIDASQNVNIGAVGTTTLTTLTGPFNGDVVKMDGSSGVSDRHLIFSNSSNSQQWDIDAEGGASSLGVLSFSTNSTERLRIDSSGNVGIGTAPSKRLHIDTATNGGILLEDSANSITGIFYSSGSNSLALGSTSNHPVKFFTNNSERMRLDASGNVGIGTTSPAAQLNLSSPNNIGGASGTFTNAALKIGTTATGMFFDTNEIHGGETLNFFSNGTDNSVADYIRFSTGGSAGGERMRITSAGNVGIGTASPDGKLNVFSASAGSVSADADADELVLENSGNVGLSLLTASTGESGIYFGNPGTNGQKDFYLKYYHESHATTANRRAFTFNTASTEHMRIDSSGNVGIAGAPQSFGSGVATLQLKGLSAGQATRAGALRFISNDGTSCNNAIYSDNGFMSFYTGTSTSSPERMRIDSSGNLQLGVTAGTNRRFYLRASGSTSTQYACQMENSGAQNLFFVRADGAINTGEDGKSPYNDTTASAANLVVNSSGFLLRSTSSARYKENIRDYDQTASIDALRPVFFNSKKEDDDKTYAGLIAEEVHEAGFTEFVEYNKDGEPDAVFYANMVALCIKEIQNLKAEVAALKGA